ncbi:aminoglycoside N(3)-acetyltransferase [Gluconobacter roseus]|uniref:Aminoglycoside N(3)-acetyltransferase n=1 Tax=Gluconobacter roseus NBRC 3990 TaxID=1307950 RepID=A0A4Y3M2B9_9PROT|nr:AAC(3) family N-acetyltransferase [Gluconobacter roseus]KXV44514.1 aminoglycoside 3-N-acetyltransferase [Gluconobacter roseus]GBR44094.1 aminoglycoside N3-acetyltransferase [Gluconobacter roseus NBRC 3990]GEB02507.1 AAC(3) family N-acetyltransferase [Gluconobacter roseus NBRC 3990]GLP92968.1 AAC(3) family N-acetyltransferase [Gluconobacter roseus NBRC 3990]
MTEAAAIARSSGPVTQARLVVDFQRLGVTPGMTLLVHASLSRIGWVCGGAPAVISALLQAVGPEGTIVMPAQSSELSDPSGWCDPPVPESWWETIRATMPPYDPRLTPTRGVGQIAEIFRTWPGVQRSLHPQVSFSAFGPQAADILARQPMEDPFGAQSPLAALSDRDAQVLMIGTGWETCTALHLAERLAQPDGPTFQDGTCITVEGERRWVRLCLPVTDIERFQPFGATLDGNALLRHGHVGSAPSRLFPLAPAIRMATERWTGSEAA